MLLLVLGLIAFFTVHSVRVLAEPWRLRQIASWGESGWKIGYSVAALAGLALLVVGYGQARVASPLLWSPPQLMHAITAALVLVAFILFASAGLPGRIRAKMGHPMTLGIKTWALAHLLSNGSLADILLFGSFLAWAVLVFAAARRRDRADALRRPPGRLAADALAIAIGGIVWFAFARWGHQWLIGVDPMS